MHLLWEEEGATAMHIVGLILSQLWDCISDSCALTGVDFKYSRIVASLRIIRIVASLHIIDCWLLDNGITWHARQVGESGGKSGGRSGVKARWQLGRVTASASVDYCSYHRWIIMDKPSISHSAPVRISQPENLPNFCRNSCLCWLCEHSYWHSGMRAWEWGHGNSVWIACSVCHPNVFIQTRRLCACLCHS